MGPIYAVSCATGPQARLQTINNEFKVRALTLQIQSHLYLLFFLQASALILICIQARLVFLMTGCSLAPTFPPFGILESTCLAAFWALLGSNLKPTSFSAFKPLPELLEPQREKEPPSTTGKFAWLAFLLWLRQL